MEGSKGKTVENAGDSVKARVAAALAEAKHRRDQGDLHGARELALSILATGEEHIEARQLLAAVELASPARKPAPAAPPPPPARPRPEVVVLGASPSGGPRTLEESLPVPPPLPELTSPLPWAPREEPPPRTRPRVPGAVVIGAGTLLVLIVAAVLIWRARREARPRATPAPQAMPSTASLSSSALVPEPSLPAPNTPPLPEAAASAAPASPVAAAVFDPELPRKVDALLAQSDFAEALRQTDEALRANPSEPRLRELQRRVQGEARRATSDALAGLNQARAAAEDARAPDLVAWVFQRASDFTDAADSLARKEQWADALAKARQAAAAYEEALDQARLDQARTGYREARARALEAGAERLAGERMGEAHARAARAQGSAERREYRAALDEYQSAATAMAEARRAALDAAAAAQRAAAPPPSPARTADTEREEILGVIRRYTAAMEARDLHGLKAVWPNMGADQEAKIRSSFEFVRSLRVQLEVTSVHVEDRTAIVLCRRRDIIVTTDGQTLNNERPGTINLVKLQGWSIAAIQ